MAFELIWNQPELFVQGLWQRWSMFFSNSWYAAFSFVGGESYRVNRYARWAVYGLCGLGLLKWLLKPSDRHSGLTAMAAIGVLASVPFVPPTDAYRVRLYAAAIVVFGLLPGMGIAFLTNRPRLKIFSAPNPEIQPVDVTVWFTVAFIALILGGPLWVKATSPTPPTLDVNCPPGNDKVAIRFDPGSFINVRREKDVFVDWMPDFHYSLFRRSVHGLGGNDFINYLSALEPQKTILSYVDYLSNRPALLILPLRQMPEPGAHIGVCGYWETNPNLLKSNIFIGRQVIVLDGE